MTNIILFSQIINKLNRTLFKDLVKVKVSDKHNKGLTSSTHLISMLFLHFLASNSLREISNGLRSATGNLKSFRNKASSKQERLVIYK